MRARLVRCVGLEGRLRLSSNCGWALPFPRTGCALALSEPSPAAPPPASALQPSGASLCRRTIVISTIHNSTLPNRGQTDRTPHSHRPRRRRTHGYGIRQDIFARPKARLRSRPAISTATSATGRRRPCHGGLAPRSETDERRIYYRLTPAGRKALAAEMQRLRTLVRFAEQNGICPRCARETHRPAAPTLSRRFPFTLWQADAGLPRPACPRERRMAAHCERPSLVRGPGAGAGRQTGREVRAARYAAATCFAAVIILTIAVGVAPTPRSSSVVNGILLRPPPLPRVERIVVVSHEPPQWLVSEPQYAIYRDKVRSFESLAGYTTLEGNLRRRRCGARRSLRRHDELLHNARRPADARPHVVAARTAPVRSPSPFSATTRGNGPFNGDSGVIGKRFSLNGSPRTVVGVMPRIRLSVEAHEGVAADMLAAHMRVPHDHPAGHRRRLRQHYLFVVGRLRTGFTLDKL